MLPDSSGVLQQRNIFTCPVHWPFFLKTLYIEPWCEWPHHTAKNSWCNNTYFQTIEYFNSVSILNDRHCFGLLKYVLHFCLVRIWAEYGSSREKQSCNKVGWRIMYMWRAIIRKKNWLLLHTEEVGWRIMNGTYLHILMSWEMVIPFVCFNILV